jgi:hypothetical protein
LTVRRNDNANLLGILLAPPDTDGDVGPNHYVQITNLVTTIFDKSGNVVLGPFPNNVFWSGLGGLCQNTNRGDPIVLYDESQDRWLVAQFALNSSSTPPWSLCIPARRQVIRRALTFSTSSAFLASGFQTIRSSVSQLTPSE